jgi:putative multicomponent Na+:H+ antiporter subunit B
MTDGYTDSYIYLITALLPLVASMLIFQSNPYHALVIRGILGAVAVLVYTVLGAADVALTEALVGTLLAVTLYAVAVRSSLVLRLGVLKQGFTTDETSDLQANFKQLIADLQTIFNKHHMRVELVPYLNRETLHQALIDKEIHATCAHVDLSNGQMQSYDMTIRLRRLYNILEPELTSSVARLTYVNASSLSSAGEPHS